MAISHLDDGFQSISFHGVGTNWNWNSVETSVLLKLVLPMWLIYWIMNILWKFLMDNDNCLLHRNNELKYGNRCKQRNKKISTVVNTTQL